MADTDLKKVRRYLKRNAIISHDVADYLQSMLPKEWSNLCKRYGCAKVFWCLRQNKTVGACKHELHKMAGHFG